jgi:hypothetical protein
MSVPMIEDGQVVRRYEGRVIREWERNGYNDSDWYVLVMEDDGTFRTFEYSTTRGGSAPANADVDATPEVLAAYKAHQELIARQQRIGKLRRIVAEARTIGLTARQWIGLRVALDSSNWIETPEQLETGYGRTIKTGMEHWFAWANQDVAKALSALGKLHRASFRSNFKRELAQQVFDWATTAAAARKYEQPLSRKQMGYLS